VLQEKALMRIGEILIREGHLTQDGLEEALDWQVLYGGRLGTNLLELRLVEEEQVARALGKQLGCEVAWGELQPQDEVIGLLPKHVADRDEMVPWKMEKRRLKVLCTEIHLEKMDQLGYKVGRSCLPVIAPEFRIFQLLRANYGATRQMRALDFGVVPTEGREERRRRKQKQESGPALLGAELIDEAAFNDIYNRVVQGRAPTPPRGTAPVAPPAQAPPPPDALEALPEDAILGELPAEPVPSPPAPAPAAASWEEPPPPSRPKVEDAALDFKQALQLLEGVSDRKAIAHLVLRASLSKARRALLLQVQGEMALGWDGLGEGLEQAAQIVAIPLSAPSAFQLVVKTRSHFLGPLKKTPLNVRFLAQIGKKVPLSSMIVPILHRGRVSHLLYLDNGHKQQAPTDVGEMLILSQRIGQTVEALVQKKRKAAHA
jgi:Type II secretion system (T2SS), protein E, N-terminal domain